jgi:hypothetical protein
LPTTKSWTWLFLDKFFTNICHTDLINQDEAAMKFHLKKILLIIALSSIVHGAEAGSSQVLKQANTKIPIIGSKKSTNAGSIENFKRPQSISVGKEAVIQPHPKHEKAAAKTTFGFNKSQLRIGSVELPIIRANRSRP